MNIVLRLLSLSGIFVSLGEGVCRNHVSIRSTNMSEIRDGGVHDVRHSNNMNTARLLRRPGHHKLKYLPGVHRHWGTRLTEGLEVFDGHKLECSGELGWWCCLVRVVGLALLPLKYRSSIDFFLIERK
jgi:hypothetical protein